MTEKSPSALYALKIALPYFLISLTWILLSDRFVESMASDVRTLTILQTYKGWFYITMSAFLIYLTARHYLTRLSQTNQVIHAKDLAMTENQRGMFTLLSNLPGMAYRCNHEENRQMEFVSEGCRNLLGYESSDFTCEGGTPYARIIVDEDREIVSHEISRAVRDRLAFQIEYRIRTKSGRVKWVSEQGCAIHSAMEGKKALVGYIFEMDEAALQGNRHRRSQTRQPDSPTDHSPGQDASQGLNIMSRRL
jgi:PAS domain-containing protein